MSSAKRKVLIGGIVLLFIAVLVTTLLSDSVQGRRRLPVGDRTPVISLGQRHGLILASDGSLWTWGSDFLGWPVLGLADGANSSMRLRRIGKETNWVSVSAGEGFNLALKLDGTLWTWGESVEVRNARLREIKTPTLAAPDNDWKQATAGGMHIVALKTNGTLWAWGNNWTGSVGISVTNGSSTPVQIGSDTNWIRVWTGIAESVAMKSDHTLWYWGENPDPAVKMGTGQISSPMQVSPDTNWVDVGFGPWTVFAIKSDGTLWSWGWCAESFTGAKDASQNSVPMRVGTNSDWRSFSASAGWWWCVGLTKNDGSHWLLDASEGKPNGPAMHAKLVVHFRQVEPGKDCVVYAGGSVHAAAPGVHGLIGVVLTREGEVWTWGMVLGDSQLSQLIAKITQSDPAPTFRDKPWRLRNTD